MEFFHTCLKSLTLTFIILLISVTVKASSSPVGGKYKSSEGLLTRRVRSLRLDRSWTRSSYGVVFVYANTFDEFQLRQIKIALGETRKHSCIPITLLSQYQFWDREFKKYPNYVFIEKNRAVGCGQAVVGMKGGPQLMTLSPDPKCLTVGTIIHEMLHTLGLEHEQSRPDRSEYIEIHNPNVQNGLNNVFAIAHGSTPYGPYDFDSVMHYGKYAFSAYPNLPTLSSKIPGFDVPAFGNSNLSLWDKRKISRLTGCKGNF